MKKVTKVKKTKDGRYEGWWLWKGHWIKLGWWWERKDAIGSAMKTEAKSCEKCGRFGLGACPECHDGPMYELVLRDPSYPVKSRDGWQSTGPDFISIEEAKAWAKKNFPGRVGRIHDIEKGGVVARIAGR